MNPMKIIKGHEDINTTTAHKKGTCPMKYCPSCNRTFEVDAYAVCPVDATPLVDGTLAFDPERLLTSSSTQGKPEQVNTRNRRKIFLISGAALTTMIVVVLFFALSAESLGNYAGHLSDLFPEKVSKFVKGENAYNAQIAEQIKAKEVYQAVYHSAPPDKPFGFEVEADNFLSNEDAKEEAKKLILDKLSGKLVDGAARYKVDKGAKKMGWSTVGDRYEVRGDIPMGSMTYVIWTNGSVLFTIRGGGRNNEEAKSVERAILDFERDFPH